MRSNDTVDGRTTNTEPSRKPQNKIFLDSTCLLRSFACLGIVVYHLACYVGIGLDDGQAMDAALSKGWLAVIFNSEPSMQTFMCLTG